jgi:hypothetical protein
MIRNVGVFRSSSNIKTRDAFMLPVTLEDVVDDVDLLVFPSSGERPQTPTSQTYKSPSSPTSVRDLFRDLSLDSPSRSREHLRL